MSGASAFKRSLLPTMLASSLFMDLLDMAALGTALPTMAREFGTDPLQLKLALTAYLVTVAILVPASGWIADRFGARRVFSVAMLLFLAGSICCGLSSSVEQLVAARVLQGIGGAMMTPVARIILIASTPRERLVQALNAFTFTAVFGSMLGPPLAGILTSVASWRWIFFINIPIGMAALLVWRSTLNVFSMIGLVMLMGLVTKNAILLVDFANHARKAGASVAEALREAGLIRMRPIMMTTAAMVFGMLPMAVALNDGGEIQAPMGRAIIGGVITSTLLTLVVVPVLYSYLVRDKKAAAPQPDAAGGAQPLHGMPGAMPADKD